MLWHRQEIFESKGDKLSSFAECRIRTQRAYGTEFPADRMPADKPTELSRIKLKTWTRQPVPMISEHSAHSTPLAVCFPGNVSEHVTQRILHHEYIRYTLGKKGCYTPGWCVFLWLFLFHQSARSKDRLFGVIWCFLCIWCPIFFYSVVFCQFWRHLMIKWVIGRMCIPKCHWKIIVVNLVEQRWFFSWRCLVVSFCVCQVNIGYSRLSRR